MKNVIIYRVVIIIVMIFMFTGCKNDTIEDAMANTNIQFSKIYHVEYYKDEAFIFYQPIDIDGLNNGYLKKSISGWKWVYGGGTASAEASGEEDLTWVGTNINKKFQIYCGTIINPAIKKVLIQERHNKKFEKYAKIVETTDGKKIWFAIIEANE